MVIKVKNCIINFSKIQAKSGAGKLPLLYVRDTNISLKYIRPVATIVSFYAET